MTFSTFLNFSSHKDNSSVYRNKTFISSPTNITPELAQELLKFVNPVTLSSTDLQGRTIQLWSYNSELVASILKDGEITIIPGDSVCNSLQPSETGSELLKRLQTGSLKKWQKVVDEVEHDIQKGSYSTFNTHLEPDNWSINFF